MSDLDLKSLMDVSNLGLSLYGDDVDDETVTHPPLVLEEVKSGEIDDRANDLRKDYETARLNVHYQQQMIMDMAKIALENAKNSESPRFMDSFTNLMSQMSKNNTDLIKLHSELNKALGVDVKAKGKTNSNTNGNITVNGAATVFVGTPQELMQREEQEPITGEYDDIG